MLHFHLLVLCFLCFTQAALVPWPIPAPVFPTGRLLDEDLTGKLVLIIGGTGGIGNASAWNAYTAGAHVTITCTDKKHANKTYPFDVMELEYGKKNNNFDNFVRKYRNKNGRNPDYIIDIGLTFYTGLTLDFSKDEMEYATRMYHTDPLCLYRAFMKQDRHRNLTISIALSTVSYGTVATFYSLYESGKAAKKDFIRDFPVYEGPKYYPNVKIVGIACAYVKTNIAVNAYNPSANRGDPFSIRFKEVNIALNAGFGVPPQLVADAHTEMMTKRTPEDSTIALVPTAGAGLERANIYYNIYVNDNTSEYLIDNWVSYAQLGMDPRDYL